MSLAKKINASINTSEPFSPKMKYEYNWRVLIVEDEPAIAEGITAIISPPQDVIPIHRTSRARNKFTAEENQTERRQDKFEVVWAKNPTEALDLVIKSKAEGRPFALGFFDVLLGSEIDGIELVRQIQMIDPKLFAVFLTAYHDRSVDSIHNILGADKSDRWDYMNKPFTDGAILQKARNSVSVWNLREQKSLQDAKLFEASNLLLKGERSNTVAAVGRSVAHEFGNILMHVVGNAELALLKGDAVQMKNALKTILKAGETASSVLAKFKKLYTPDQEVEFKIININQCIDESVDLMAHEFKKRNIAVTHLKFESTRIDANYHSLVQVFVNLFINSMHAMHNEGEIEISVQRTPVSLSDYANESVEIRIRDYGPGIPEELIPKVVDPFYTTKGNQGTGLGLSISKEIIEIEHQGEFIISNHPEQGLEILIRLPIKQEV